MTFSNPYTGTVLTSEIDFFYWPCMSGEKFAPALGASASYASKDTYPAVKVSAVSARATIWPAVAAWRYDLSAYNGFTVSFRANAGGSNTNNGPVLYLNPGQTEYLRFLVGNVPGFMGTGFNNLGVSGPDNVAQNTWYTCSLAFAKAGTVTVTINGTSYGPFATSAGTTALQAIFDGIAFGGGVTEGYVTQLRVSYT